jgi:hypothetical protein
MTRHRRNWPAWSKAAWLHDARRISDPWRVRRRRGLGEPGQFETFFYQNVKPNVPGVEYEVIELHAVVQP